MKNHFHTIKWAVDYLVSQGYDLQHAPEIIVEAPWSNVLRFATSEGNVYLKQTTPALFLEPKIMQLLAERFNANVPVVLVINDDQHCFFTRDAGVALRKYLKGVGMKSDEQNNLLCQCILHFTALQRSIENDVNSLLNLGVPDWRLAKLPELYEQILTQTDLLKEESVTEQELQKLHSLIPKISRQCELLSQYKIPETLAQPDFNTNNMVFDPNTKKMTSLDLGEIAITHPFFSLHNFINQATIHHGVKEADNIYYELRDACFKNWLNLMSKDKLLEVFALSKELYPIYWALEVYRLMMSVDLSEIRLYYKNNPTISLAWAFRKCMAII